MVVPIKRRLAGWGPASGGPGGSIELRKWNLAPYYHAAWAISTPLPIAQRIAFPRMRHGSERAGPETSPRPAPPGAREPDPRSPQPRARPRPAYQ